MTPQVHVVLVRSEYANNVGASARAMANMGYTSLVLLQPQCVLTGEARAMAEGGAVILDKARVYNSWNDFFASEGEGIRLGLTRRAGRNRKVFPFADKVSEIFGAAESGAADFSTPHLYLIFGPEADGLGHDDLAYVNFAVNLPVYGEFASFNLAQAVLLTLFLVRQAAPPAVMPEQLKGGEVEAVQPFYFPDALIKEWLMTMGFDVEARKASAYLTLRKLFLQSLPTRHEIQVLEAILQQNIRKLKHSLGLAPKQLTDDSRNISI